MPKPVWTYAAWRLSTTSNSNIEILHRYQSKTFRLITEAQWSMINKHIDKHLGIPTVKIEIVNFLYRHLDWFPHLSNLFAVGLLADNKKPNKLKSYHILDLPFRKWMKMCMFANTYVLLPFYKIEVSSIRK